MDRLLSLFDSRSLSSSFIFCLFTTKWPAKYNLFSLWNFLNMRTRFQLNKLSHHYLNIFLSFQHYYFHHYSCEMCQRVWIFFAICSKLPLIFFWYFSFLFAESYILQISISPVFSTLLSNVLFMVAIMVKFQWLYQLFNDRNFHLLDLGR